jgi:phosphatidylethanolamine/phosphatidyl-N-methylethanolamine N-methyltransferase
MRVEESNIRSDKTAKGGKRPSRRAGRGYWYFWKEFCRAPRRTGGFAPSSRFLAKEIVEQARVQQASSIIELGPGTGVLTNEILKSKSPHAPYLAIEQSGIFCSHLRSHFPGIQIVNGCAGSLYLHAHQQGFDQVGCIVSSLPWTILDEKLQALILSQVHNLLQCGGYFATCVCFGPHLLRAGRTFHRTLSETFRAVNVSHIVLRNVPPAFIYCCAR